VRRRRFSESEFKLIVCANREFRSSVSSEFHRRDRNLSRLFKHFSFDITARWNWRTFARSRKRCRGGCWGVGYGESFSFRVICGSLVVRIDAASRPITIHRTTITPLGYIPARARRLSSTPFHPLSFSLFPACTRALFGASAFPDFLPTFFISTCLITNSQAYLPPAAASPKKNCPGFELLRVTPLTPPLTPPSPLARPLTFPLARLELPFVISPAEIQIIPRGANDYLSAAYRIFRSLFLSQF